VKFLTVIVAALAFAVPATASNIQTMQLKKLEREARNVGLNGGITCHTVGQGHGCATPYMRSIVRELIVRYFPAGDNRNWALCVAGRESGYNPAAISYSDDHGVGQLNRPSHSWVDYNRIAFWNNGRWASDPVYSTQVFVRLSRQGANRSPWAGGVYSCPRY
jgi:hypothetical protein